MSLILIKRLTTDTVKPVLAVQVKEDLINSENLNPQVKNFLNYAVSSRNLELTKEAYEHLTSKGFSEEFVRLVLNTPKVTQSTDLALLSSSLKQKISVKEAAQVISYLQKL